MMKAKKLSMFFGMLSIIIITSIVSAFGQTIDSTGNIIGVKAEYTAKASDGTSVVITSTSFITGQPLVLGIQFNDSNGNFVKHQNYAITVIQDNDTILSNPHAHTHTGMDIQTTQALSSTDQINIHVTLLGVGLPTTDPSIWTGVKGETLGFSQVAPTDAATVPEFGQIASIVLAIAILSVVVFAAKTRVIPRL